MHLFPGTDMFFSSSSRKNLSVTVYFFYISENDECSREWLSLRLQPSSCVLSAGGCDDLAAASHWASRLNQHRSQNSEGTRPSRRPTDKPLCKLACGSHIMVERCVLVGRPQERPSLSEFTGLKPRAATRWVAAKKGGWAGPDPALLPANQQPRHLLVTRQRTPG